MKPIEIAIISICGVLTGMFAVFCKHFHQIHRPVESVLAAMVAAWFLWQAFQVYLNGEEKQ